MIINPDETNTAPKQLSEFERIQNKLSELPIKKEETRAQIARYFVVGYFTLSVFVFVFVFIYNLILLSIGKDTFTIELIQTFTAVSGALSGLLGFVLGYYFKSKEE
ncbi:hypothetical protein A2801_00175 [Candidatus Woesebacteria bacterium RIFCSPHIGHO2_01_FULL_41_10]|uniref:Uncharacterized protein n=1 Tax=Candidatus Woesebacteria bacterium RIFCSPHIGHO2_01_FULL_41_10 TaxID=1802500 RepID=A0A1F7YR38_9BACT|nr:MAG: hypothetical protein A2801_00175 [Candidatus Woesebacteria bacterium RIFCSPHIGHO2_01_FULL_41_10]